MSDIITVERPETKRLDFETVREDYNYYKLPSGVLVKIKVVVQEIYEQVGSSDPITGLPNYLVRSSNVVSIIKDE